MFSIFFLLLSSFPAPYLFSPALSHHQLLSALLQFQLSFPLSLLFPYELLHNGFPDTDYGKRLEKLTGNIKEVDGLKVNFGVYEVIDVNAFACGDGSVRICAGLMDIMTDDEVMAVVGHEIGHVIHTDSKDAMKNAYLRSAVKNAAGAASSTVSKLSDSELGAMAEALAGAQYSQKQETEADDYGFEFCIKNNLDPYAMYNALNKLLELSAEAPKESKFQKMFSSHPDTAKRVARAKEKADEYMKDKK